MKQWVLYIQLAQAAAGIGGAAFFLFRARRKRTYRSFAVLALALILINLCLFIETFIHPDIATVTLAFSLLTFQTAIDLTLWIALRLREKLDISEAMLHSIHDGATDLIFSKNTKGVYLSVNRAFETVLKRARHEVEGHTDRELFPAELAAQYERADQATFESGVHQTFQVIVRKNDEDRIFMVSKAPYRDADGVVIGLAGIGRDITELIRARDLAQQADKAKSQFLANMSHEIRTPLNGVVGMAELALATPLNQEQRYFIESVSQSAEALLAVINDILDFSKIEAGKLDIESIVFDLPELVQSSEQLLRLSAEKKRLQFRIDIARDCLRTFVGDPGRIRQVLINLASNAIKFTQEGEVIIQVTGSKEFHASERASAISRTRLQFSIRDTGIGIGSESQAMIFEAFAQADGSTTRKFGGTGLGLSISKRLVNLMGGQIGVESILGTGSNFWFRLDLADGAALSPARESSAPSPQNLDRRAQQKILVAEDNPVNQTIILRTLKSLGYRATGVSNGREVLQSLETFNYDLILMDGHMPELDGLETTRAIRSDRNSSGQDVIIVALTANAMMGERERCLQAGMDDYLSKPVTRAQLDHMLRKWLEPASAAEARLAEAQRRAQCAG